MLLVIVRVEVPAAVLWFIVPAAKFFVVEGEGDLPLVLDGAGAALPFNSPRRCFRSIREAGLNRSSIEPRSIVHIEQLHTHTQYKHCLVCGIS